MDDKPVILAEGAYDSAELDAFKAKFTVWRQTDVHDLQLRELAEIRFPGDVAAQDRFISERPKGNTAGCWVYFPWSGILLHCVNEDELFELRTNRNKNLISRNEQSRLAENVIAVAGMSVGSGIALSSIYSGISNTIKLADFDVLETANLNRLREPLSSIGTPKLILASRHIYELNPFAKIIAFEHGVSDDTIDAFFQEPTTSVVVDEIDDFRMKIQLRLKAKQYGIPLIMFTSLGDSILIDVERYDQDKDLALFNGDIPGISEQIMENPAISPDDAKRYAVQLVGAEYVPTKALGSLLEMGKTLVGRPQLYSTIAVDGGLAAYLIRSLILGDPVQSGRYVVRFSEIIGLTGTDFAPTDERNTILAQLLGPRT